MGTREGGQRRDAARSYCRYFRGTEGKREMGWKVLMNPVADMYGIATDICRKGGTASLLK
jgi:hypothetical protein